MPTSNPSILEIDIVNDISAFGTLFELDIAAQKTENSYLFPLESEKEFRQLLTEHDESHTFAMQDPATGRFMGYICLAAAPERHFAPFTFAHDIPPTKLASIPSLVISPDFQRRGCGLQLMAHTKSFAKAVGYQAIALHVQMANEPAMRLYLKSGFRLYDACRVELPYGRKGGPRVPMAKHL